MNTTPSGGRRILDFLIVFASLFLFVAALTGCADTIEDNPGGDSDETTSENDNPDPDGGHDLTGDFVDIYIPTLPTGDGDGDGDSGDGDSGDGDSGDGDSGDGDSGDGDVCSDDMSDFDFDSDGFCPKSQGYWSNHFDEWPELGAMCTGEPYNGYICGESFEDILWMPTAGDIWVKLARQWVAAALNGLAGADMTPIADDFGDAQSLLEGCSIAEADEDWVDDLTDALEDFNNESPTSCQ